ncbi:MAG: hypothetical protein IPM84_14975 [Anaerolineae bacterium]|nr:hypothetical protein [Anaerolineae bacterium]
MTIVLLLILSGLAPAPQAGAVPHRANHAPMTGYTWDIRCVDCPKALDELSTRSLRLDSQGRPHIAYGGDHLYYAWHDGSAWQLETVDSGVRVGAYASLALDSNGSPHIGYFDSANFDLRYASKSGNAWVIQTVDANGGSVPASPWPWTATTAPT